MLQVHHNGIRHVRPDGRISEWKTPGKKAIQRGSLNSRQVAVSLAGGEIIYFELDAAGMLMEMGSGAKTTPKGGLKELLERHKDLAASARGGAAGT